MCEMTKNQTRLEFWRQEIEWNYSRIISDINAIMDYMKSSDEGICTLSDHEMQQEKPWFEQWE